MRRFIFAILLSFTIFLGCRLYYRLTDDFRLTNITCDLPYNNTYEPLSSPEGISSYLSGPFYYIGKGAQAYVFASHDDKYIIKIFKFKHLKPSTWVESLAKIPCFKTYAEAKIARKKRLIASAFTGYKLGFDNLKNETGLLYIHLNKTKTLQAHPIFYDKLGLPHAIDLDQIFFVIQKKATTTRKMIQELVKKEDLSTLKRCLSSILDLYLTEYQKGLYDRDHGVLHNTGFVDGSPIHYDIGKLTLDPRMKESPIFRADLEKVVAKFEIYLRHHYPSYYPELVTHIENTLSLSLGAPFSLTQNNESLVKLHEGDL